MEVIRCEQSKSRIRVIVGLFHRSRSLTNDWARMVEGCENFNTRSHLSERRESTINKLIQNILSYVVYFTAIVMILDTMTIPIASLLAGAGVVGLAIGFGAQSLVQDVISGFFIIFEDQFGIGDYVLCSGVEGTVLEIGLRTTKIQAWTGELNVIPNGKIDQV